MLHGKLSNQTYHDELKNSIYHLLPQRKKDKFKDSEVRIDPQNEDGSASRHVHGDEHLFVGCSTGDPVSPELAKELRCDHQRVLEDGN
jgi:hypothetical protein